MTEKRKILSLVFIAFLVLVLPIALLLSRQRQEIRKRAAETGGTLRRNLRVNPITVMAGNTIDVYIEGNVGQGYGYIEGKLDYDTASFQPVGDWTATTEMQPNAHLFEADGEKFIFGANSDIELLSGQMLKLTLRASSQITTPTIERLKLVNRGGDHLLRGITLDGTEVSFDSDDSIIDGIDVAITLAATSTPTPTATVRATSTPTATPRPTLGLDSARIILGTPTIREGFIEFPINFEASSIPTSGEFSVHFDTTKLSYDSVVHGSNATVLQVFGLGGTPTDKTLNFRVSSFNAASGNAAIMKFTLVSGVQTATVFLRKAEIPDEVFLSGSSGKFGNIVCAPDTGTRCEQTYTATSSSPTPTPTPTVHATASPTPTAVPGAPVNSITAGTVTYNTTLQKYQVPIHMNFSPVPRLFMGQETAGYTIKMLGSPSSTPPDSAMFRPEITDCSTFANPLPGDLRCSNSDTLTSPSDITYIFDSATPGTTKYLWAVFHNDAAHTAAGGALDPYWIGYPSTSWSRPVSVAVTIPPAGDVNGNGCVGACDTSFVINHYQSACLPNAVPINPPVAASNGDFNHDGCVDASDINTVIVNGSLCANDCSQ